MRADLCQAGRESVTLHSLGHLQPNGANSTQQLRSRSSRSHNFTPAIGDVAPATRVVVGLREALLHPTLSSPPSLLAGGGARLVAAPRALLSHLTPCKFHLHRTPTYRLSDTSHKKLSLTGRLSTWLQ